MGVVGSVTAAGVIIGLASRPFKTMRKTVDDAVGDLKGQTSDLRTELKGEVADLGTDLKGGVGLDWDEPGEYRGARS